MSHSPGVTWDGVTLLMTVTSATGETATAHSTSVWMESDVAGGTSTEVFIPQKFSTWLQLWT